MRRAVAALRYQLARLSTGVGLEGAFVLIGTGLLAAFAQSLHPLGAVLIVGIVSLALGLALAVTPRRTS